MILVVGLGNPGEKYKNNRHNVGFTFIDFIAKPPLKSPPYKGGEMGEVNNETIKQFNYAFPSMTSVKGIFAAGDCVDFQYRQAGTAVGMGIAAALEVEKWLEISGQ